MRAHKHFFTSFPLGFFWNFGDLETIVCNRFNKPQTLNIRSVTLLSLRGPNVLFSSQIGLMVTVLRMLVERLMKG